MMSKSRSIVAVRAEVLHASRALDNSGMARLQTCAFLFCLTRAFARCVETPWATAKLPRVRVEVSCAKYRC